MELSEAAAEVQMLIGEEIPDHINDDENNRGRPRQQHRPNDGEPGDQARTRIVTVTRRPEQHRRQEN
ncbi:hypothetical protein [Nocardia gipuzkoensis]|uniref:hypothetical protein n=1 Tax=Nocardia gipuzkoensis TaxID=2749991 RepID=UPI002456671B|nr:hypothetical protein [Nocardia gipuzkoensis]